MQTPSSIHLPTDASDRETPDPRLQAEAVYAERLAEVTAFIEAHGRRPSPRSTDSDEHRIGVWIKRQRSAMVRGVLPPARLEMMAAIEESFWAVPRSAGRGKRTPRRARPGRQVAAVRRVREFYETHGRLPDYKVKAEITDYQNLTKVRSSFRHGKLSAADLEAMRGIPGVLKIVRLDPAVRLAELQAWCAANGRLPRHSLERRPNAVEVVEVRLGQWMYRHVNRRHEPVETPETAATRDAIMALRDAYPAAGEFRDELRAQQIVDFIEKTGRMPAVRSEHVLYENAFRLRAKYRFGGAHHPATVRMLELIDGLPNFLDSQWDGQFVRLRTFVDAHGRLPAAVKRSGPGRPGTEYLLTVWLERESGQGATVADPARRQRLSDLIDSCATPRAMAA